MEQQNSGTKAAIIGAVLTGIFTVIAGIATYWFTTKEPSLGYTVAAGPTLPSTGGLKRIFVIEVRNGGSKEISQTYVQLDLPSGEISELAAEASPGVKLNEERKQRTSSFTVDLLNPGDSFKVSLLAAVPSVNVSPRVTVRAPGIKGEDLSVGSETSSKKSDTDWLKIIAAVLASVALSSFLVSRTKISRPLGLMSSSLNQSQLAAFICDNCELDDEAHQLRFSGSEPSYRNASDYLLARALSNETNKHKYVVALKALLLNKQIASESASAICHAIKKLNPAAKDEDLDAIQKVALSEGIDPVRWRNLVTEFIQSNSIVEAHPTSASSVKRAKVA